MSQEKHMEDRSSGSLYVMLRSSDLVFKPRQSSCLQNHSSQLFGEGTMGKRIKVH